MVKICIQCRIEKSLSEFYPTKISKKTKVQLYTSRCKDCCSKNSKNYYKNNRDDILEHVKIYRIDNLENISEYLSNYYIENRDELLVYKQNYRRDNKDKVRKSRNSSINKRRKRDSKFRLARNFSKQIWAALKGNKNGRSWEELTGYTQLELRNHIESLWIEGMNWDNWGQGPGTWQIDHIIARCRFSYKTAEDPQFQECWKLSNLQPLWDEEHKKKSIEDKKLSVKLKKKKLAKL